MAQVDEVAKGIYRICTFEPESGLNSDQFLTYPTPKTATSATGDTTALPTSPQPTPEGYPRKGK